MLTRRNQRSFLQTIAAAAAWPGLNTSAEELTGDVKLTIPTRLTDESLNFIDNSGSSGLRRAVRPLDLVPSRRNDDRQRAGWVHVVGHIKALCGRHRDKPLDCRPAQ